MIAGQKVGGSICASVIVELGHVYLESKKGEGTKNDYPSINVHIIQVKDLQSIEQIQTKSLMAGNDIQTY